MERSSSNSSSRAGIKKLWWEICAVAVLGLAAVTLREGSGLGCLVCKADRYHALSHS